MRVKKHAKQSDLTKLVERKRPRAWQTRERRQARRCVRPRGPLSRQSEVNFLLRGGVLETLAKVVESRCGAVV